MKIQDEILHPYFVECEENSYTLKEIQTVQSGDNKGNNYELPVGYFVDFRVLLLYVIKAKLSKQESVVDLKEYLEQYKTILNQFQKQYEHLFQFTRTSAIQAESIS